MTTITQRVVAGARRRGLTVHTRAEWGSKHGRLYQARRVRTRLGKWGTFTGRAAIVVQHITVTRPSGDFKADCRTVEQIGFARFGSGVSYNWLVDMTTGEIAVGQPLDAKGTHTINDRKVPGFPYDLNRAARAIAVIGMPGAPLSGKAADAIAVLLAVMAEQKAITSGFDYLPHSRFAVKDCPCGPTRDRMPEIHLETLRRLGTI